MQAGARDGVPTVFNWENAQERLAGRPTISGEFYPAPTMHQPARAGRPGGWANWPNWAWVSWWKPF